MGAHASCEAQHVVRVLRRGLVGAGLLLGLAGGASAVSAQGTAVDNAVARARALVESGNGRAGRLVLDSMVQEAGMSTPALGELLYWRGLLAESSSDAERDWRRLLLEVPISPRAEDALLRLAQLEQLRGRPAASRALLERMVRDYREPSSQARAHFWLAKAWFDENDRPRACGALDVVRRDAPESAVELRTQSDDLRTRCRGVTAVAPIATSAVATVAPRPAAPTVVVNRDSLQRDSVQRATAQREAAERDAADRATAERAAQAEREALRRAAEDSVARAAAVRDSVRRADAVRDSLARVAASRSVAAPPATSDSATRPANARYSVQLAALNTMAQAEQFLQRFRTRGIEARVDGTSAPFRVRTGYFATRAQANARLAELKRQGHDGFVAELTP
jgi:cell division protein FtsN